MDEPSAIVEKTTINIPMVPIEHLKQMTAYVNEVKKVLMIEGTDYVIDRQGRQYTARKGFAKLAQGFSLSDDKPIITTLLYDEPQTFEFDHYIRKQKRHEIFETKTRGFEALVRVVNLPSGRYAWGEGACTVEELKMTDNLSPKWYHRCLGTAKTRAWNRAVSNYVGSAEVSAEEMGLTYPGGEDKSSVKVVDFLKGGLKSPEWDLRDELNRSEDSWKEAKSITLNWLQTAGVGIDLVDVKSDSVKILVKTVKPLSLEDVGILEALLVEHGFNKTRGGWRLNKSVVAG